MSSSPPLAIDDIRSTLITSALGRHIHLHQQIASTNAEALSLAQLGAAHGTVVLAESQTSGRGRHARTWFSPAGMNVYCSIIVRGIEHPLNQFGWLSWLPLASALAVAEAVQGIAALPLSLKWPNDLLLHGRKAGGILCEGSLASATDPAVVIGIGLNVNMPQTALPEELQSIAASLIEASRHPIDRNRLIAELLLELEHTLDELRSHGPTRLRQAYISRCITLGRRVRILFGGEQELVGTAETISGDGALQVRPFTSSSVGQLPPLVEVRAADVIHLTE